jgi:hypothetical protein
MRADQTLDGGKALPPFLAMGDSTSVMWNRTQVNPKPFTRNPKPFTLNPKP